MARPIDIHLPGGTILLTPPGLLPDRLIGTKFLIRDGRALARLRSSRTGLAELRREFHLLELHLDPRFAGDLALLGALEGAVARRRIDLHWLPEDCASEVTPRADLRDRVPTHVRDWFAAEKVRAALTRARPLMPRNFDHLMEQLLEPKHLLVGLPLILDLAEPKGGAELMAFGFSAGRWEGLKGMEALAKATAECVIADDERMIERAASGYADALTALGTLVLGRLVERLGTKGIQPNAPPVESKIRAAAKPAPRAAPAPAPREQPKPAPAAGVKPAQEPKPDPKKAPAASPTCKLVKLALTCEHGRAAGPQNILMVVPNSAAAFGDKISGVMTMQGQCGQHPTWAVGGFWTSNGKGAKFDFNAAKWSPSINGLFSVKSIEPHVYRVSTAACAGSASPIEVRAYPPGGQSAKLDARKLYDKVQSVIKKLPIPEEQIVVKFGGAITWSAGWKEDEKSWKAYCEFAISGAFDPLLGIKWKGQIYPPNLVPASLGKWVKAGLFVEISAGFKASVGMVGRYWPDTKQTTWSEKNVKAGGAGGLALSLELKLASSEIVEGALSGESGLELEGSGVFSDDPKLALELKWPGLKAKATLKAAWGYVEYSREWQLIGESKLLSYEYPLARS